LLMVLVWRGAKRVRVVTDASSANLLFGLRIFPFAVSALVTVFFTFPSFWLMEKPALDEDTETFLLAVCALCILGAGLYRVLRIHARTARVVDGWRAGAAKIEGATASPMLSAAQGAPPLVLVGVCRPRVMISDEAREVLSDSELQVAVRHEIGHARSWDNLKKVLITAAPFPGMSGLEKSWHEAAELAADDRAVTNRREALDLAAALIKLSRSCQQLPTHLLATGLMSGSSSIGQRVDRLLKWRMAGRSSRRGWILALPVLLATIVVVSNYGAALVLTHRLTEFLVP